MKIKKSTSIVVLVLCIYVALQIVPYGKNKPDSPFFKEDRPLIIAHGGAKEMNPENTWMAFEYADAIGADVIETDLRMTKDGILVTHHNEDIDSYCEETGNVRDYTYEELKSMNFGYDFTDLEGNHPYANLSEEELAEYAGKLHPVNLEELFARYGKEMRYILEVKDSGKLGEEAADLLLSLISKYGLEEYVCVASFNHDTMIYMNEHKPENVVSSFDMKDATNFVIMNYAGFGLFANYDGAGFQLPMEEYNVPLATKYLIYKIHKNNMFVHYWTINTKEEMRKCIKNGADGIITDRPDLLIEVLNEMGYAL